MRGLVGKQEDSMKAAFGAFGSPIELRGVVQAFGRRTPFGGKRKVVLDGVDFSLGKGEIVCLLGPSGCGKTTLVNLVVGLAVPVEGTVRVLGEVAPYPHARLQLGYMPQHSALYEDITAIENLRFFGVMNRMKRADIASRAQELLEFTRLSDSAHQLVSTFSGGMKQRLSLAVAMMHDPQVLVLDEPTVGLDPSHRVAIWDEFDRLASNGKSILVTTHIMDEAARCDRIVMLQGGRVMASGSPASILESTGANDLEQAFLILEARERKRLEQLEKAQEALMAHNPAHAAKGPKGLAARLRSKKRKTPGDREPDEDAK